MTVLQVMFKVKGYMVQGQRSCESRLKVTLLKPGHKGHDNGSGITSMSISFIHG